MKKEIIALLVFFPSFFIQAQLGVNTKDPKTTMHIMPTSTGATTPEGFIAPSLTRAQLISKELMYTQLQKGAIIYVTDLTGTLKNQTAKVTAIGYYYFDGKEWQSFSNYTMANIPTQPLQVQGSSTKATLNTQNVYQEGNLAIGTTSANAPSAYTLDVKGTSNVSGNSRVGSSTIVGAQTIGGFLGVAGATTLGSTLTVAGVSNLNSTTNTKATNISGQLNYKLNGVAPTVDYHLRTDASGNATWQPLPDPAITEPWQVQGGTTLATLNSQDIYQQGSVAIGTNTAGTYKFQVAGTSNITGNSRVGSSTVAGSQSIGGTLGVAGASTLIGTVGIMGAPIAGTALKVTGKEHITGRSRIGAVNPDVAAAQLNLAGTDKGFLGNRVALTNILVKAPVTNAVDGMLVYNVATVPTQKLTPGYYYWGIDRWHRLLDVLPVTILNIRELAPLLTTTSPASTSIQNNGWNTHKGRILDFGELIIPEDGSYAFSFRLYGEILNNPNPNADNPAACAPGTTMFYYITAMLGSAELETDIRDTAEIDLTRPTNTAAISYSVTLAATFKKGDKVVFRLSHNPQRPYPWKLKADSPNVGGRTSMIWWKL